MKKVSIIIPAYQSEATLERCVDSLIGQTYDDLEIILSDDGSTDNTAVIADGLAERDKRVRVIHAENGGVSRARNRALDAASGEYVCFVDSDDWAEPRFIETMVNAMEKNNADMAMCGWYENDTPFVIENRDDMNSREALYLLYSAMTGHYFALWNKIFRREALGRFDESISYLEDGILISEYLLQAGKVSLVSEPLYHYIELETSLTHSTKLTPQRLSAFDGRMRMAQLMQGFPDIGKIARAKYHETVCWLLFNSYKSGFIREVRAQVGKMSTYRMDFYTLSLFPITVKIRYIGYELILGLNLGKKLAVKWGNIRK